MKRRLVASTVLAAGLAITAAGCAFATPAATQESYEPSDGTAADVGTVEIVNALVILNDDADLGSVVFGALNTGTDAVTLDVSYEGDSGQASQQLTIGPGDYVSVGTEPSIVFENFTTALGANAEIYFQYAGAPGVELAVPVHDGTLAEYASLVPTPTPTPEPEPEVVETPEPTGTATPGATGTPTPEPTATNG